MFSRSHRQLSSTYHYRCCFPSVRTTTNSLFHQTFPLLQLHFQNPTNNTPPSSNPSNPGFGVDPSSTSSSTTTMRAKSEPSPDSVPLPGDMFGPEKQRQPGQKKTMDEILRDVMNEALIARDKGEKPDMDFVYKKAQERIYEEEYGEKPPTTKSNHRRHIPFPARSDIRRITPFTFFEDDPWPLQPGEQKHECVDEHGNMSFNNNNDVTSTSTTENENAGDESSSSSEKMKQEEISENEEELTTSSQEKQNVEETFLDASDELAHWEKKYVNFLRDYHLGMRRSLPIYADYYKHLTHRLVRAERRYVNARDAVVSAGAASPQFFAQTEKRVARARLVYVETHKSLTQSSYEPTKIRKSFTGKMMNMSPEEYEEWLDEDRDERNADFANMRGEEQEQEEKA